jgi:hypothetical protein
MKPCVVLMLLAPAIASAGTAANGVRVEWSIAEGGNGHSYEVVTVPDGITWFDAHDGARSAGGYLVTITSQEEEHFVERLVDDDACWSLGAGGGYGPWIGCYQLPGSPEPDGGWQWVAGQPLTYTNWGQDQPNNMYGTEDCAHLGSYDAERTVIIWNDLTPDVENIRGYVVEFSKSCQYTLVGDLNGDCRVDLFDLALMAGAWLVDCNAVPPDPACMPG